MKNLLLSLALLWAGPLCAEATLLSETVIDLPEANELSAIELDESGTRFVMVTDRGVFLQGTLRRESGKITGLDLSAKTQVHDTDGNILTGSSADSEGVAFDPAGRIYVSFEGNARIWRYDTLDGPAYPIRRADAFDSLQSNSGLEALATAPDGTIYTIPERSGEMDRPFPVYRYRTDWDVAFTIPRSGSFLVTGADVGPDGKLYVLERDFLGIGFRTRVRSFNLDGTGEETLLQTWLGKHSNLEGIAVWRDPEGKTRLTMVSDNGQTLYQTTVVEYRLDD